MRHSKSKIVAIASLALCLLQLWGNGLRSSVAGIVYSPRDAKKCCPCCRSGHCQMPCCKKAHIPPGTVSYGCLGGSEVLNAMVDQGEIPVLPNSPTLHWTFPRTPFDRRGDEKSPRDGFRPLPSKVPILG